jgi:hypothetical protein
LLTWSKSGSEPTVPILCQLSQQRHADDESNESGTGWQPAWALLERSILYWLSDLLVQRCNAWKSTWDANNSPIIPRTKSHSIGYGEEETDRTSSTVSNRRFSFRFVERFDKRYSQE